ncbi:endonuclease/exonuclease/phosphatase family protein, partial [Micromonospora sp. CV4]
MIVDAPPAPARHRADRIGTVLCWLAVVPTAAWASARLAGLDRGPLVQALAFTPYVAGWSVLALALALALRRWRPAAVAALAAAALLGVVAPRAVA